MRRYCTPLVYTVDGMAGREARAAEKWLEKLLAEKWRREYSEMVRIIQARMSLALIRSY